MDPTQTLTLAEAFAFLGVSEKTLRNWCKAQRVPYTRVRNERGVLEYRFKAQDLEALVPGKTQPTPQTALPSASAPETQAIPSAELRPPRPAPRPVSEDSRGLAARTEHPDGRYREELLALLREENAFLKAQLIERDRQLAAKERQLEKQLERLNTFTETLSSLTKNILSR